MSSATTIRRSTSGADVENILTFAKRYPGVDQIAIEENFRSSDGIVKTARPNTARPYGRSDNIRARQIDR